MIYITGDTHGDFSRFESFCKKIAPTADDTMIILGDAGLNYYNGPKDFIRKEYAAQFPLNFFCIHGNHEMRPTDISTYKTKEFCGGTVWYEEQYPSLLFAKDGEIYSFGGYDCIVVGGAYSVDKYYRLSRGASWFENEQPSDEIKAYVEQKLAVRNNEIDIVLSHTCPLKYEPAEVFLSGLDQSTVDKSTEKWLGKIEAMLDYKKWYCGHYHTIKKTDKLQFIFEDIDLLGL